MKKRKWQGQIVAELLKNYQRREPRCRHFLECGGCSMQDFDYEDQLVVKAKKVGELINSKIKIENSNIKIHSNKEWEYRTRMDFVVKKDGMGLRRKRSFDKVVNLEECYLVDNRVLQLCRKVYQVGLKIGLEPYDLKTHLGEWRYISVRVNENGELMLILITKKWVDDKIEKLVNEIFVLNNDSEDEIKVKSVYQIINDSLTDVNFGETRKFWGEEFLEYTICNIQYAIKPNTFFQNNINVVEKLVDKLVGYVDKDERVVDLFCGVGTLSLPLAKKVQKLQGMELVADSIELAKDNAKLNNIDNAEFVVGNVWLELEQMKERWKNYQTLVLDPPRVGLEKAREKIMEFDFKKIIYMSCNPLSLVKDLEVLQDKWKIQEVTLWDLYPQTPHVECLAYLTKEG
ncbi:MAG TPA: 23S rRNA (uracil(1939)-C(5))-methyltransferase RlmD [bacterium]|nr:23S rRNA (uracil(1939)-C(5))-methyltransferase RlmD [bacterium]